MCPRVITMQAFSFAPQEFHPRSVLDPTSGYCGKETDYTDWKYADFSKKEKLNKIQNNKIRQFPNGTKWGSSIGSYLFIAVTFPALFNIAAFIHIWWCRQWSSIFGTSQQMARSPWVLFNFRLCPFAFQRQFRL